MIFLINASNINEGGGVQVTQSLCGQIAKYPEHNFIIILSSYIDDSFVEYKYNSKVIRYDKKNSIRTILLGRDVFLDKVVEDYHIDAVLTVFGPSVWVPKVPHLCGFARAQLVIKKSPYISRMSLKEHIYNTIVKYLFKKSSKYFFTENEYITNMLPNVMGDVGTYTVSNYFNQIYDQPSKWRKTKTLPAYDGFTSVSISTHYPHKNFEILIGVTKYLKKNRPDFKVRFVLSFNESDMPVPEELRGYFCFIGVVDVSECPYLYEQSDIMFMPTLLECFTATYPEAMRMGVPIVTTDLEFAHGLCGDAACYYSAVDPEAAAEAIYKVATNKEYAVQLVANGKEQLKKFDNYEQRADKLIKILEEIAEK